jgi:hypothetical protein
VEAPLVAMIRFGAQAENEKRHDPACPASFCGNCGLPVPIIGGNVFETKSFYVTNGPAIS